MLGADVRRCAGGLLGEQYCLSFVMMFRKCLGLLNSAPGSWVVVRQSSMLSGPSSLKLIHRDFYWLTCNVFNFLNWQLALVNICHFCPSLFNILINTYKYNVQLFIDRDDMWSREGTIQGNPLAMPMFAVGVFPLIRHLHGTARQVWYADDSTAAGSLKELCRGWDELVETGCKFGYLLTQGAHFC